MLVRPLVPLVLGLATVSAQTPPCASLNAQNNTVSTSVTAASLTGPTAWGYQITLSTPVAALALQIFTGNTNITPGSMTLEVWSDANNLPGTRLGGGTWRIWPSLGNSWQGANLDTPVLLAAQTAYWLVWIEPGFSTVPHEPGGTTIPAARRSGTTWSALAAPAALKYRILCNRIDGASVTNYGQPCGTTQGALGTAFSNHEPKVGNADFSIEGTGFPNGAAAALLIGVNPNFVTTPVPGLPTGCALHTDILVNFVGKTGTGNQRANVITVGAAGHVWFQLGIPASGSLVGTYLATQIAVLDASSTAALPFVMTNALRLKVY